MGMADAAQLLPYLAGSKSVVAYQYPVKTTAFAHLFVGPTIGSLAVILLVGFAAAFFVPRLPLGIPRRDFSVFTWLAAFEGDGMIHQAVKQNIERNME
ncbi:6405_t:CDS:2 [Acaulospora colombiana]|uniref:6405_t:CDS:1 n=1 Tax=Acaulospora colombiana TaxID=27376 RepID=A0ACA9NX50_9GLOM|nr:6405_t:CDS:2 [Acaulospora colombiana]